MKAIILPEYLPNILRALKSLEIDGKEIPRPSDNQVLVKMTATPCNPSDIAFMRGDYNVSRPLPAIPGFEGTGVVVDAGVMREARGLISNRVCCFLQDPLEGGTWAEYFVTDWRNCIEIRNEISDEQAATMCINPFTAVALFRIALKKDTGAIIQNAASGQIGRFLNNLAKEENLEVINLVRKEEQIRELKEQGFKHVLNINDKDFEDELRTLSIDLDARIAFDAVGGELSGKIFNALPSGSDLVLYGGLSGQRLCDVKTMDLIFKDKKIKGFNLGDWKNKHSLEEYRDISKEVQELVLAGKMETTFQGKFKLEEHEKALTQYIRNMSKGKVLFTP